ncbi:MAG: DUF1788 domain-containing protein [Bacteroidales bacterium]|nr:DUF1788 domain-containing protein [Bacteroidales bacterium]
MTVEQLYDKLCSKTFQDTENGDLFYNFYLYLYPCDKEYQMRNQIAEIKESIKRPRNNVDVLTLDIFEEFCRFMDSQSFGKWPSLLKYMLEKDEKAPANVTTALLRNANSDQFMEYIHNRIMNHVNKIGDGMIRPYVFLYGIGNIYPYLRTSSFLNRYEKYNRSNRYKIILFYPGDADGNTFKLFGTLDDQHTYRAIVLMNE